MILSVSVYGSFETVIPDVDKQGREMAADDYRGNIIYLFFSEVERAGNSVT